MRQKVGGTMLIFAGVLLTVDLCSGWYEEYNYLLLVASLLIPMSIPLMAVKKHPYIISGMLTFLSLLANVEYIYTGALDFFIIIDMPVLAIVIGLFYLGKSLRRRKSL